jgi:hypothetical protein
VPQRWQLRVITRNVGARDARADNSLQQKFTKSSVLKQFDRGNQRSTEIFPDNLAISFVAEEPSLS